MVDGRDPLLYRSDDLEDYVHELHPHARPFILLNKSDLLPRHVRDAWADNLEKVRGLGAVVGGGVVGFASCRPPSRRKPARAPPS